MSDFVKQSGTSASGGFITPQASAGAQGANGYPLNDNELQDLLQLWFAGVTSLNPSLVRPLWQEDPPETPPHDTTWLAFGIKGRPRDFDAYQKHVAGIPDSGNAPAVPGHTKTYRNEELRIGCVAYGPQSDAVSAAVWNNGRMAQNRELLRKNGIGLIAVEDATPGAEYIKSKYVRRVDFDVRLRRAVSLLYPILDVVGAEIVLLTDVPESTTTIEVPDPGFGVLGFGETPFGS